MILKSDVNKGDIFWRTDDHGNGTFRYVIDVVVRQPYKTTSGNIFVGVLECGVRVVSGNTEYPLNMYIDDPDYIHLKVKPHAK